MGNLRLFAIVTSIFLLAFSEGNVFAAGTLTKMTGGANISVDNASNASSPAWTTLGAFRYAEGVRNDISAASGMSLTLTAPTGWIFNTTGVAFTVNNTLTTPGTISQTASTITIANFGDATTAGNIHTMEFSGVQIRLIDGANPSATGNIIITFSGGTMNSLTSGTSTANASILSNVVGAQTKLAVILPGQTFTDAATLAGSGITGAPSNQCQNVSFNISSLKATDQFFNIITTYSGAKIIAYSNPTGSPTYTTSVTFASGVSSTTLATTLTAAETTTITAKEGTSYGCPSSSFTVSGAPSISSHPSTSPLTTCQSGAAFTALSVTASGAGLTYQWYSNATSSNSGGTLISGATSSSYTPSNSSAGTIYYYCIVSGTCSPVATSNVSGLFTVNAVPTITGTTPASRCGTGTVSLGATASAGTINWYAASSGGSSLGTGTSYTTPSISTTTTYYIDATNNGCTTATRTAVAATINNTPPAPTASGGSGATSTAITANWAAASGATGYYLDVATDNGFTSFVTGYNNLSVGNVLTYNVTGLTLSTTYYYRVRATNSCGTSSSSGNITYATTGAASYCSPSSTLSGTYINNFSTTNGITNITNNGTGFTTGGYANYFATLSVSQYAGSSINWSATMAGGSAGIAIWVDWDNSGSFETGERVYNSASYLSSGTYTGSVTVPAGQAVGDYALRVLTDYDASSPAPCTYTSNRGEAENYKISVLSCSTPNNISSPGASVASASSSISWTNPGCYDQIMIVAAPASNTGTPSGGGSAYIANLAYQSGTGMGNGYVVYKGTSSPQTITGLANGTMYYFKLFTRLGSSWSSGVEVSVTPSSVTYCGPPSSASSSSWITDFSTSGGVTNITNIGTTFSVGGYGSYTGMSASQYQNTSINFSLGNNGSSSFDRRIWVDWNQDGDFVDAGEQVYSAISSTTPVTSSFTVPATATLGSTRMRVIIDFNYSPTSCDFSGTGQGEAEDYTFTILGSAPAPTITSISPTSGCVGSQLVINGTNFTGVSASNVKIGGTAVTSIVSNTGTVLTVVVGSGTTGTVSVTTTSTATSSETFTVNPLPSDPGNPTSDSPQCTSPGVTLTRTGSPGGGETWYWQTNASGTSNSNSGSTYNVTTTGTYYIRSLSSSGCWSTGAGNRSVTINTAPASSAATPSPANMATGICYSGCGAVSSVSWGAVSGATSYDVYFGAGSLPGTVTSNVATTTYSTGVLSASTTYYWKVVAKNACGSASASTWTFTTQASTCAFTYCTPTGNLNCSSYGDYISNVFFNTLNNSSTCGAGGYTNYSTAGAQTTSVVPGNSYSFSMTVNSSSQRYAGVWFDFDQNGVFTDANEFYTISFLGSVGSTTIPVPSGAIVGYTRMRVRYFYTSPSTITQSLSCTSAYTYGETEDYTINVCNGPTITTQPSTQSICIPSSVSFNVAGTGATGYQWRKDGAIISGATSATYTINPTSASDVGVFDCLVSNAGGCTTLSNTATLSVYSNPTITVQPTNQTSCSGKSTSFALTATGTGITYQWYKGGIAVSNGGNISGATTNTLSINPTNTTDAGNYYCTISGSSPCIGSVTSGTVSLTVNASPSEPITTGAARCGTGIITLSASGAGAGENYKWYDSSAGGTLITSNVSSWITPSIGATTTYYVIKYNTTTGCESSPFWSRTPVVATINATTPSIALQPVSHSVVVGASTSFTVAGSGDIAFTYQWQVSTDGGSTWTNISNGGVYSNVTSAIINITAATIGMNNYKYRCVVTGSCSTSATSDGAAVLTVSNDFVMPSGTGNTLTICSTNFYDNGGSGGTYSGGFDGSITFYPATVGNKIQLVFSSFTTENSAGSDGMMIYNGNSIYAPIISSGLPAGPNSATCPAGSFYGNTSPGTKVSTATDGSLTITFKSDATTNLAGWAAAVSCIAGTPMSFSSSTTTTASTAIVTLSATNEPIIGIQVVTNNSSSPFNVTQFQINMTGTSATSDVSAIKIYYTGNDPAYGAGNLFGSVAPGTGTLTVNGSQLLQPGTNYFWVAYNIASNATPGHVIDAECTQITMNCGIGNKAPTVTAPVGSRPIGALPSYFIKKYGIDGWARGIVEDPSDHGLVWAGYGTGTGTDMFIVKTDANGNTIWGKAIGGASDEYGNDIITSSDGGFVVVGTSTSSTLQPDGAGTDRNIVVTKVNSSGAHVWTNVIGATGGDEGASIIRTADNGFAIAGEYDDGTHVNFYFVKLDASGTRVASLTSNLSGLTSRATSLIQTSDGGYLIGGYVNTGGATLNDFYLVKITGSYTFDWAMQWGGSKDDYLNSIVENAPNDYTIFGTTYSAGLGLKSINGDIYAMRFTNSGSGATEKWSAAYGTSSNESAEDAVATVNGGYIVTGYTDGLGAGGNEIYILKIDNIAGDLLWTTTLGTTSGDQGFGVVKTFDGGYVVAALGELGSPSGSTMYLLKVKDTPQYACSFTGSGGSKTAIAAPSFIYPSVSGGTNVFHNPPFSSESNASKSPSVIAGSVVVNICSVPESLPVELLYFTGYNDDEVNVLRWSVASELNNDYFTIEHSNDSQNWQIVGIVDGSGTTNSTVTYSLNDEKPYDGITYYRLMQTDFDGSFKYSDIISISKGEDTNSTVSVFPNPFAQTFCIQFNKKTSTDYNVEINNYMGQNIQSQTISEGSNLIEINMDNLPDGIYYIKIFNDQKSYLKKIVKNY
jgi:hypothetical protein